MGWTIGIFSAKGGVGKSLIAANLGAALSMLPDSPTLVVDLHPVSGSADLLLDVKPEKSWVDLLPVVQELTERQIQLAAADCGHSLELLAAPGSFWRNRLDRDWCPDLAALVSALEGHYQFLVADGFVPQNGLYSHFQFDLQLIVVTPDAPALRATSRFWEEYGQQQANFGLVLNQWHADCGIRPREIQDHLGLPLWAVLPIQKRSVWQNITYGTLCVHQGKNPLREAFHKLAVRILKSAEKGSFFEFED